MAQLCLTETLIIVLCIGFYWCLWLCTHAITQFKFKGSQFEDDFAYNLGDSDICVITEAFNDETKGTYSNNEECLKGP